MRTRSQAARTRGTGDRPSYRSQSSRRHRERLAPAGFVAFCSAIIGFTFPDGSAVALQLFPASGVLILNEPTPVQTQYTGPNSAEFMTFMRAYQDMVFSTAARLAGNDSQAEDIAQEVFIRAYEHFSHLCSSPTAGGWLKTVTTNLALNYLTRYRKRWRFFSELNQDAGDDRSPEPHTEWAVQDTLLADLGAEQRRELVDKALRQLPPHQRVALVLYHFEELSYQEIADKLGISLTKIKTDIRRARAALVPILQSNGLVRECP
jgi:RNA polymerase sigma-70 factor (ECF subfamily)